MARRRSKRDGNTDRGGESRLAGLIQSATQKFAFLDRVMDRVQPYIDRYGPIVEERAYWLLNHIHRWVGEGLVHVGHYLARGFNAIPWSVRFSVLFAFMALQALYLGLMGYAWLLPDASLYDTITTWFEQVTGWGAEALYAFRDPIKNNLPQTMAASGLASRWHAMETMAILTAMFCAFAIPFTLLRKRISLLFMKIAVSAFTIAWCYYLYFRIAVPSYLHETDYKVFDDSTRNDYWLQSFFDWMPMALLVALCILALSTKRVIEAYRGTLRKKKEPIGDRLLADFHSHGGDPRFRTSWYWSAFAHFFILFYPFFLRGCGMEEPYAIPKGSGNPVVEMVRIKKPKKKPKKKYILAQNSPFIFERPEIDDSKVMEEVDQKTENTYVATQQKGGKMGKGGGKRGGWPNGMEGKVRFIRLKYRGGDWDQDMGVGADHNILVTLNKLQPFIKVADRTEAKEISRLKRFPKHRAPPFVFITGKGSISVTSREVKILRWYCIEEGGMIFADNGGGHFDSSFRSLMRRVFPDKPWIDIANDDIIFRQPFLFPKGAPPLWHHSGYRAMGIKHNGRWIVFYHQGDLNDAWKEGHSGVSKGMAMEAYKMGINVMCYSFNQYLDIHFGQQ